MNRHPNPNWATEVPGFYFADESDLNEDGWLDPWNRSIKKENFSQPHRATTTPGINRWSERHLKCKYGKKLVRLDVYEPLGTK